MKQHITVKQYKELKEMYETFKEFYLWIITVAPFYKLWDSKSGLSRKMEK